MKRRFLAFALWLAVLALLPRARPADQSLIPEIPAPTAPGTVELPPFLVEETEKKTPWIHGEGGGFEVLSRTGEDPTYDFVEGVYHAHQLLDALVPLEFQAKLTTPATYLLYGDDMKQAVPPEILNKMTHVNFTPNFMLTDVDEIEVVALVSRFRGQSGHLQLTPNSVHYLLTHTTPGPPPWFVEGFLQLYLGAHFGDDEVTLPSVVWVNDALTDSLQSDSQFPRPLIPMAQLFFPFRSRASMADQQFLNLWRSQAALFVRWAMDPKQQGDKTALWKFVSGASLGKFDEVFFQECFGMNYADMLDRLTDYLNFAVKKPLVIKVGHLEKLRGFELRRATDAEVSRIKGEWERLEIGYVKTTFPPMVEKYRDEALLTVRSAYNRGERDPGLLGVMGLDAVDAGDDAGAKDYLQAAVAGAVRRPRVYYEFARVLFQEALAKPEGKGGRFSPEQVAAILDSLAKGRQFLPAMDDSYTLFADVLMRRAGPVSPDEIAILQRGIDLFPLDFGFLTRVVLIEAHQGMRSAAAALVARGVATSPEGAVRARLLQYQAALAQKASPK